MLSHAEAAGAGSFYYKETGYFKENSDKESSYYREDGNSPMFWFGTGAANHDLTGSFKGDDYEKFDKLLNGELEGKKVTAPTNGKERRTGEDFTSSVPKSFSIAAINYGDERIIDALKQSVETVGVPELGKLVSLRQKINGETTYQKADVFGALAIHERSRPTYDAEGLLHVDPQLHIHIIIANLLEKANGDLQAAHYKKFTKDEIRTIDEKIIADFVNRVRGLGYDLEKRNGVWEIKAISKEICDFYSQRSEKDIKDGLTKMGLTRETASAELKQAITSNTRNSKVEMTKDGIAELNEILAKIKGHHDELKDYVEQVKGNGKISQNIEMTNERMNEITKEIDSGLRSLSERNSLFKEDELFKYVNEHNNIGITAAEIKELLKDSKAITTTKVDDGKEVTYLTTKLALARDEAIALNIELGKGAMMYDARKISSEDVEKAISNYESRKGFSLSADQVNAIKIAALSEDRFIVWQGVPGSGKTVAAEIIKDIYEAKDIQVSGLAPRVTAVNGFNEIGVDSITSQKWAHSVKSFESGVVLIDEAGLLSAKEIKLITDAAARDNVKTIFIGDQNQMQSVEAGNALALMQDHGVEKAELTTVMRQKNETIKDIVKDLTHVDERGNHDRVVEGLEKLRQFSIETGKAENYDEKITAIASAAAEKYVEIKDSKNAIIITDTNNMRDNINIQVRAALQEKGELGTEENSYKTLKSLNHTDEESKRLNTYQKHLNNIAEKGDNRELKVVFSRDYINGFRYEDKAKQNEFEKYNIDIKKENIELRKNSDYFREPLKTVKMINKNEEYTVKSVNGENVVLENKLGEIILWSPEKTTGTKTYEKSDIKLSVGDEIVFRENQQFGDNKVNNSTKATITKISDNGFSVKTEKCEEFKISKDDKIIADYAYARTIDSTQSIKEEAAINAIDSSSQKSSANLISVGVSRAVNEVYVVTDNYDNLVKNSSEYKYKDNAETYAKSEDVSKYNYKEEYNKLHNPEYLGGNSGPAESRQDTQRGQEAAQDGREQGQSTHSVPSVYPASTQMPQAKRRFYRRLFSREPLASTQHKEVNKTAKQSEFKEINSANLPTAIKESVMYESKYQKGDFVSFDGKDKYGRHETKTMEIDGIDIDHHHEIYTGIDQHGERQAVSADQIKGHIPREPDKDEFENKVDKDIRAGLIDPDKRAEAIHDLKDMAAYDLARLKNPDLEYTGTQNQYTRFEEGQIDLTRNQSTAAHAAIPTPEPEAMPAPEPEAMPAPEPEAMPAPEPEAIPTPEPEAMPAPEPEAIPTPEPEAIPTPEPEAMPAPEPEAIPTPEPEAMPAPEPEAMPAPEPEAMPAPEPDQELTDEQLENYAGASGGGIENNDISNEESEQNSEIEQSQEAGIDSNISDIESGETSISGDLDEMMDQAGSIPHENGEDKTQDPELEHSHDQDHEPSR
jgi:conjugative relaxase-like TrwC/TraI family protein